MELKDTIPMMTDSDYKERFRAEYFQLRIRCLKLNQMLGKYATGTLEFVPVCPYELLFEQHRIMWELRAVIEERARIEGIDLTME